MNKLSPTMSRAFLLAGLIMLAPFVGSARAAETAPAAPQPATQPSTQPAEAEDADGNYPGETKEMRRERLINNYEEILTDLSPDQKQRILAALEPSSEAMKAARLNPALSRAQRKALQLKMHHDVAKQIDPI